VKSRDRKSIDSRCSRITCLVLPLAAQSPGLHGPEGCPNQRYLTIANENKQYKKINKTVHKIVPKV
jgi:hypothetical protein